ncbi:phosphatidate cytidylyltransferase [Roseovarius aestuarii]|uniref:Phosphatidate cytidylyltransferase n=1 Tax=Roseovarius aestuarii TaxID=475083 RepID=A0A1X7BPI4_9RHOB|nr:phosphatidate cytidylyltransferase [Roseovarius aestuarii]SMC11515.1 Phosphatidate cytidylyltransferase [Roseovarius aestuarii]
MNHDSLMALMMGVVVVLILASTIGGILSAQLKDGPSRSVVENLNARIWAWWVMVILLGLAFLWGRTGVTLLFAVCSFNALREFITLTNARRADHWMLAAVFFVVLPLQYYLVFTDWYGFYTVLVPVYVFLLMPVISALRGESKDFLIRVAEVQWAAMVTIYFVSHVPALLSLNIPGFEGQNIQLVAFLIIVVQASDVLQYIWSKLLGKHKMAPRLSPAKTIEGFVGGVASATVLGACLWWVTPFTFFQAGVMSLVIALMGFFGGLVLSAIKRDRGVKDWGDVITGHGGFIDRLDSIIFAAPIFFHLTRYWWHV